MPTTTNTVRTTDTARSTLIAAFPSSADAQAAVRDLEERGVPSDQIQSYSDMTSGMAYKDMPAASTAQPAVHHEGGFTGWLKSVFGQDEQERDYYDQSVKGGVTIVSVEAVADRIDDLADILNRHHPSNIHEQAPGYATGLAGRTTEAIPSVAATPAATDQSSIPVIEENLAVGKRSFLRGGVRVYSRVVETPVSESVNLRDEHVYVDRQAVDRPVDAIDLRAGAEQVIEVEEYAEEPVINKRARVVEEIRVGKNVTERTETVNDTLRRTEVDVEPIQAGGRTQSVPGVVDDPGFRTHFQENYGATGESYETYGPAYDYGYMAASDPRFAGRPYSEVEPQLRTDYANRYPNSTWDRMKDSIRYGWDRVTGKTPKR